MVLADCGLDVLAALALTDDHERHRQVRKDLDAHQRYARAVRRALTQGEVEVSEALARFVGVKAYEKAGGQVCCDLFQQRHEAYFTDRALLESLASTKLTSAAAKVTANGAAWAEVLPHYDYAAQQACRPTTKLRRPVRQQTKLAALDAEEGAFEAEFGRDDSLSEDARKKCWRGAIQDERDTLDG